jgi:hypothetical protein
MYDDTAVSQYQTGINLRYFFPIILYEDIPIQKRPHNMDHGFANVQAYFSCFILGYDTCGNPGCSKAEGINLAPWIFFSNSLATRTISSRLSPVCNTTSPSALAASYSF